MTLVYLRATHDYLGNSMVPFIPTFPVMKDFPTLEVAAQFTRLQAERRILLARLDQQGDRDNAAARDHTKLARFEQVPLEVVAHRNQIPTPGIDCEFLFL